MVDFDRFPRNPDQMTRRVLHAQVDTRALRLEKKHDQSFLHAMASAMLMLIRAFAMHAKRVVHASHPASVVQGLAGFASALIQSCLISQHISSLHSCLT